MRARASMTLPPLPSCRHDRTVRALFLPRGTPCVVPFVPQNCIYNELAGLRDRVMAVVPRVDAIAFGLVQIVLDEVRGSMPHVPRMSNEEFIDSFSGAKREVYSYAMSTLQELLFSAKDAIVKDFGKLERYFPTLKLEHTDVGFVMDEDVRGGMPMPRGRRILPRPVRYNCIVGPFLKPMEKKLYRLDMHVRGPGSRPRYTGRIIAKGRSMHQRARDIRLKWERFDHPCAIVTDASRWDMHVAVKHLKAEHAVYLSMNGDPLLARALKCQLVNKGFSRHGIKWESPGGRMSGDMNTALGNCLLMTAMMIAFYRHLGIDHEIYDDGDDCLVIVEAQHVPVVLDKLPDFFQCIGVDMKVEGVSDIIEGFTFCQTRYISGPGFEKMVRLPWREITSMTSHTRFFSSLQLLRRAIYTFGQCSMALNAGVPLLQEIACALMREGDSRGIQGGELMEWQRVQDELKYYRRRIDQFSPLPISDATRDSFSRAFGIGPSMQQHLEHEWRYFKLPCHGEWCPSTTRSCGDQLFYDGPLPSMYPLY